MHELVYPTNEFLHFQNEVASVVEHTQGYISVDWKPAPLRSAALRELYAQTLELLICTRHGRILTNNQLKGPIMPPDAEWLLREWVPQALAGGYRRCAIVQSHDALSRQTTREIMGQLISIGLTFDHFTDRNVAVAWLLSD